VGLKLPTVYHVRDWQSEQKLFVVEEEKDLRDFTTNKLKYNFKCAAASAKAMSVLGLIRQQLKNINIDNFR